MEQLLFDIVFWGIFVGGGSIFVIFCFIMGIRQYKREKIKQKNNHTINIENETNEPKYTINKTRATVIERICCVKMVGTKTPKTIREFSIVFEMKDGNVVKINVPEEMYDGFEEGQMGILTTVDGELYSFEPEECSTIN